MQLALHDLSHDLYKKDTVMQPVCIKVLELVNFTSCLTPPVLYMLISMEFAFCLVWSINVSWYMAF